MHIRFAVRPGSFFVHRLLASARMPRIAASVDFADRMADLRQRVALGLEFHGDLEFGWGVDDEGFDANGGTCSAPMCHLFARPAQRTLF